MSFARLLPAEYSLTYMFIPNECEASPGWQSTEAAKCFEGVLDLEIVAYATSIG
jgi:hypothetical protein